MSTAVNKSARRIEPASTDPANIPAPPPPPTQPVEASTVWEAAGHCFNPQIRGSFLRTDGTALDICVLAWPVTPNARQWQQNQWEVRKRLEDSDRAAVLDAVRTALGGDDAGRAAEHAVAHLPDEAERLTALADEWAARLRRLKIEKAAPDAVAEAENAVARANKDLETIEAQLVKARDDLVELAAQRTRRANEEAARVVSAAVLALKAERLRLFAAIVAKIGPELDQLAAVEMKLLVSPNREQNAAAFAAEALASLES